MLVFVITVGLLATVVGCSKDNEETTPAAKDVYQVVYNYNYGDKEPYVAQVPAGTRANNMNPKRSGYTLDGWYTSSACNPGEQFDFSTKINQDVQLWAKWTKDAAKYVVTLDYNYEGGGSTEISVTENKTISTALLPGCPRLGFNYKGWYTTPGCAESDRWHFESDTVTDDITLYAAYELDPSIPRDEDGNIVYDGVEVTVWGSIDFGTQSALDKLIAQFNFEHAGSIHINYTTALNDLSQSRTAIRRQQIDNANVDALANYYAVKDVYELAGLTFDAEDYYSEAIRNCYVNGTQYSVPLAAGVPYIIYNKALMAKYNADNALPDNYTAFKNLMIAAYDGEIDANGAFLSAMTGYCWTFKECTSYAAFIQNDSEYYLFENGLTVNKWGESGSAAYLKAETAYKNLYHMFGANGTNFGGLGDDSYEDTAVILAVSSGNALMGIVNAPANTASILSDGNIGIMPLSGFFADEGSANKDQIPVMSLGFQFYKARDVSPLELAAGAVFVDYVSRNTAGFAEAGFYPLRKSVVASSAFQNSTNATVKALKNVGDPENFRTLDGYPTGKAIFNTICAEGYIVPQLNDTLATDATLASKFALMYNALKAQM